MFKKLFSKIFPGSPETQFYNRMNETLREILLPLGFTENQNDIQASLSKQCIFQRENHQVTLHYNMREREYALLSPNLEHIKKPNDPTPPLKNKVLFTPSYPLFTEENIVALRNAVDEWLKEIE